MSVYLSHETFWQNKNLMREKCLREICGRKTERCPKSPKESSLNDENFFCADKVIAFRYDSLTIRSAILISRCLILESIRS